MFFCVNMIVVSVAKKIADVKWKEKEKETSSCEPREQVPSYDLPTTKPLQRTSDEQLDRTSSKETC